MLTDDSLLDRHIILLVVLMNLLVPFVCLQMETITCLVRLCKYNDAIYIALVILFWVDATRLFIILKQPRFLVLMFSGIE